MAEPSPHTRSSFPGSGGPTNQSPVSALRAVLISSLPTPEDAQQSLPLILSWLPALGVLPQGPLEHVSPVLFFSEGDEGVAESGPAADMAG